MDKAQKLIDGITGNHTKERWEEQYAKGEWAWLRRIDELGHHSVLAGYFHYLKPGGSILDIGCGEGLLQERLNGYEKYVGVDLGEAIKIAAAKAVSENDSKTKFAVGDMNTYTPEQMFDAMVFNESIYYLDDITKSLRQYDKFLNKNGVMLISVHQRDKHQKIWDAIEQVYTPIDECVVINKLGTGWTCKALMRPAEAPQVAGNEK